jgi:hypothetical protein
MFPLGNVVSEASSMINPDPGDLQSCTSKIARSRASQGRSIDTHTAGKVSYEPTFQEWTLPLLRAQKVLGLSPQSS